MNIKGIEIKNFKELKHGHGDSRTFEAAIYIDGKKAGFVSNNGWGGSDEYHFISPDLNDEFTRRVNDWATENNKTFEPEDALIEELIYGIEKEKFKKKTEKKGFRVALVCRKDKEMIGNQEFWQKEWMVALRNPSDVDAYVKKEGIESYEVIS